MFVSIWTFSAKCPLSKVLVYKHEKLSNFSTENKNKSKIKMCENKKAALNFFDEFVKQQGSSLTNSPIAYLRKELRDDCLQKGVSVKEVTALLSKERRRSKKVLYSAGERKRNKEQLDKTRTEMRSLLEEKDCLRREKYQLCWELEYYHSEMAKEQTNYLPYQQPNFNF